MAFFDKDSEREYLQYFLSARTSATGEELTLVADSEAPDFVCKRPSGELVGVEHTRIEYNPERTEILQACRAYDGELDNFAVFFESLNLNRQISDAIGFADEERSMQRYQWGAAPAFNASVSQDRRARQSLVRSWATRVRRNLCE